MQAFSKRIPWRPLTLVISDLMVMTSAVALATWVMVSSPRASDQLWRGLLAVVVCHACLYYSNLYDYRLMKRPRQAYVRFMAALGATAFILATLYSCCPAIAVSRHVLILAMLLLVLALPSRGAAFRWIAERVGRRERLLLVGTSAATVALARELYERRELGVTIVGFIDGDPRRIGESLVNPGILGTFDDIPRIVSERAVDRVVVSLSEARGQLPMDKLLDMRLSGVRFDPLARVYEEYTGKIALDNLRPSWLIFSDGFRGSTFVSAKRAVDVAAAILGLTVLAPAMLLVGLAVKVTSRGPVLLRQRRVGQGGADFTIVKFRSMREDAEALTGPVWAQADDARVTTVGRFLRRSRLDELPQLWNVLKGEMSLVGPRPERPEFVRELTKQLPFYQQRHAVKPGLTGWAQVSYRYGASVQDAMEKLQLDLFYIKNMSLALDVVVMFKTIRTLLERSGT